MGKATAFVLCACLLSLMTAVPAWAVSAPSAGGADKGGDAKMTSTIFYYNSRGFVVVAPSGWEPRGETAARLGTDAFFVPVLEKGQPIQAFIYLKLGSSDGTGDAAVDAQTAYITGDMAKRFPGTRPVLEKGEGGAIASGQSFYLRRINHAPAPHSWESVVYLESDGVLLSLVLVCKSSVARQVYEPALLKMAKDMHMMEVRQER